MRGGNVDIVGEAIAARFSANKSFHSGQEIDSIYCARIERNSWQTQASTNQYETFDFKPELSSLPQLRIGWCPQGMTLWTRVGAFGIPNTKKPDIMWRGGSEAGGRVIS